MSSAQGFIQQVIGANYILVSTVMILVYDWFLTIGEEAELVWKAKWGSSQVLYYLNRYTVFIDTTVLIYVFSIGNDASSCIPLFILLGVLNSFGFIFAQLILAMRTWAVWGGEKWVTVFLGSLMVSNIAVNACVLPIYLRGVSYLPHPSSVRGCSLAFKNRLIYADFISILALESVMLILLVTRALKHYDLTRSTLMKCIFNDGVMYFAYIAAASILNLMLIIVAPISVHNLLIATQRVFHSIFCTRIILHIRAASSEHRNVHLTSITNSGIERGDNIRHSIRPSRDEGGNILVYDAETEVFELVSDSAPRQIFRWILYSTESMSSGWGQGHGFDDVGTRSTELHTVYRDPSARSNTGSHHADRSNMPVLYQNEQNFADDRKEAECETPSLQHYATHTV